MSQDLADDFREAIENNSKASSIDRIESRSCTSNEYSGTEYNFFGTYIPIRPIMNVVAKQNDCAIEHMGHIRDGEDQVCLGVFVADLPEQPHPAFVN